MQGFSAQNLWRMRPFYESYRHEEKLSPLVREISWSNNQLIHSVTKKPFFVFIFKQNILLVFCAPYFEIFALARLFPHRAWCFHHRCPKPWVSLIWAAVVYSCLQLKPIRFSKPYRFLSDESLNNKRFRTAVASLPTTTHATISGQELYLLFSFAKIP